MSNSILETRLANLRNKVIEANDNKFSFTLNDLIAEVKEEIKMRQYVYANHVLQGKKSQRLADKKIEAMETILRNLETQRDSTLIRTDYTILGHPLLVEYRGIQSEHRIKHIVAEIERIFKGDKR